MIKNVKQLQIIPCLEVTLEHPLKELGEFPMFVSKFLNNHNYIFSIPLHNWSYVKEKEKEINFLGGPSAYRYEEYKPQLIEAMKQAISIIEETIHDH